MSDPSVPGPCPICTHHMQEVFQAVVLQRHMATYDHCPSCEFLRARRPHWLDEAYSDAIAITDTGLLQRNLMISRQLAVLLEILGETNSPCLDYAGGYGVLVRLMRDRGYDFYWSDPYCGNLLAKGFEYGPAVGACGIVTAFEVLEHVENPRDFVRDTMSKANSGTLVFSTELYSGPPPNPEDWWYYSLDTGQHISFFSKRTLKRIAELEELFFFSGNGLHILSRKQLPQGRLKLALGRSGRLLSRILRRRPSRTWADHELMTTRLRQKHGKI